MRPGQCGSGRPECSRRSGHWVVEHDDLRDKLVRNGRGRVNRTADVTTADITLADTTDIEPDVVAGDCLGDLLVVHLDGLDRHPPCWRA